MISPRCRCWRDCAWGTCWWSWGSSPFRCSTSYIWGSLATTTIQSPRRNGCFRRRIGSKFAGCVYGLSACHQCLLFPWCFRGCPWRMNTWRPSCCLCFIGRDLGSSPHGFCWLVQRCPHWRLSLSFFVRFAELWDRNDWGLADDTAPPLLPWDQLLAICCER